MQVLKGEYIHMHRHAFQILWRLAFARTSCFSQDTLNHMIFVPPKCWGKAKLFDNVPIIPWPWMQFWATRPCCCIIYRSNTANALPSNTYNMKIATSKLSFILNIHNTSHNLHNITKQVRLEHVTSTCIPKTPWKSTTCSYCTILLQLLIVGNMQLFFNTIHVFYFLHPPKIQVNTLFTVLLIHFMMYKTPVVLMLVYKLFYVWWCDNLFLLAIKTPNECNR